MKIIIVCAVLCIAYLGFEVYRMRPLVETATRLVHEAKPFSRTSDAETLLVLGDSTAVGVGGLSSEDSIAGRMAALRERWSVENHAESGARIRDLAPQIEKANKEQYAMIVIQIGANDIIRFTPPHTARAQLEPMLAALAKKSDTVILLTAGNVGATRFFPKFLNPFYTHLTLAYHRELQELADSLDVTYVNLYSDPAKDPFILEPQTYLAPDGLHPSSHGYRLWHERVEAAL